MRGRPAAAVIGLLLVTLLSEAGWGRPGDTLHFSAGGTMSGYVDLTIDLANGQFTLAEAKLLLRDVKPVRRSGIIAPVQLDGLRDTALHAMKHGFRSRECLARERAQRRRGIIPLDMPPTADYTPSLNIVVDGQADFGPANPFCWSPEANQLANAALLAARSSGQELP